MSFAKWGPFCLGLNVLKLQKRFKLWQYPLSMGWFRYPIVCFRRMYLHLTSLYHTWSSAACGIAMLQVDEFPYPRKQTNSIE